MLRKIYYTLPPAFRFWVRRLYYLPNDLFSKSDAIQPPKGLIYTGSGDFLEQGKDWLQLFIQEVGLQKEHHFLDIGSGIGRIALPLTAFLTHKYEGFEAMQIGTDWCKANISTRFPHFHFQHIALYNDLYNSGGINAAQFQFPYENDSFDMACSISVFTHMVGEEVGNYLKQTHRVLKKGDVWWLLFLF